MDGKEGMDGTSLKELLMRTNEKNNSVLSRKSNVNWQRMGIWRENLEFWAKAKLQMHLNAGSLFSDQDQTKLQLKLFIIIIDPNQIGKV